MIILPCPKAKVRTQRFSQRKCPTLPQYGNSNQLCINSPLEVDQLGFDSWICYTFVLDSWANYLAPLSLRVCTFNDLILNYVFFLNTTISGNFFTSSFIFVHQALNHILISPFADIGIPYPQPLADKVPKINTYLCRKFWELINGGLLPSSSSHLPAISVTGEGATGSSVRELARDWLCVKRLLRENIKKLIF